MSWLKKLMPSGIRTEGNDRLVYEERDPSFYMGVGKTTSDKYICISVSSNKH